MVKKVPAMVEFLIVFWAFSIFELVIVALSIPRKANKVAVVVIVIELKSDSPLKLGTLKLPESM